MIAVPPDASLAPEHAVHGLRHPDREAAHPALEGRRPVRFHYQVQMVGLDAVVQDAEALGTGCRQRAPRGDEEASVSEGGHAGGRAQRHVGGTVAVVKLTRPVRHERIIRVDYIPPYYFDPHLRLETPTDVDAAVRAN